MMRRESTLAWFGTAMLIATAPYVARATLEESGLVGESVDPPADARPREDAAAGDVALTDADELLGDATTPSSDAEVAGPRLPNGEPPAPPDLAADTGGCSCRTQRSSAASATLGASVALALVLLGRRRRS